MLNDFKKFLIRGNLLDLAIGFTVGAAFTTVVKSLVTDIIMPPAGMILGNVDFEDLFLVLKSGEPAGPYEALELAQKAGAVTLNWGLFVNNCVSLLLVGLVMFVLIRFYNRMEDHMNGDEPPAPEEPSHKKCGFCKEQIPYKAVRCPRCTSKLAGFEARVAELAPVETPEASV